MVAWLCWWWTWSLMKGCFAPSTSENVHVWQLRNTIEPHLFCMRSKDCLEITDNTDLRLYVFSCSLSFRKLQKKKRKMQTAFPFLCAKNTNVWRTFLCHLTDSQIVLLYTPNTHTHNTHTRRFCLVPQYWLKFWMLLNCRWKRLGLWDFFFNRNLTNHSNSPN